MEQVKADMPIRQMRKRRRGCWIWSRGVRPGGNRTGEMAAFVRSERTLGMCRAHFSRLSAHEGALF